MSVRLSVRAIDTFLVAKMNFNDFKFGGTHVGIENALNWSEHKPAVKRRIPSKQKFLITRKQ